MASKSGDGRSNGSSNSQQGSPKDVSASKPSKRHQSETLPPLPALESIPWPEIGNDLSRVRQNLEYVYGAYSVMAETNLEDFMPDNSKSLLWKAFIITLAGLYQEAITAFLTRVLNLDSHAKKTWDLEKKNHHNTTHSPFNVRFGAVVLKLIGITHPMPSAALQELGDLRNMIAHNRAFNPIDSSNLPLLREILGYCSQTETIPDEKWKELLDYMWSQLKLYLEELSKTVSNKAAPLK